VSKEGALDPQEVEKKIGSNTQEIVLNHASNVTGTLLAYRRGWPRCEKTRPLLSGDAAQTAGAYPIDMERDGIDLLAFNRP